MVDGGPACKTAGDCPTPTPGGGAAAPAPPAPRDPSEFLFMDNPTWNDLYYQSYHFRSPSRAAIVRIAMDQLRGYVPNNNATWVSGVCGDTARRMYYAPTWYASKWCTEFV